MLIACASDAHGEQRCIERLVDVLPQIEAFCFLGDCERDGDALRERLALRQPHALFVAVVGNNDPGSTLAGTEQWTFGNIRTLVTHGHLFRVKLTLRPLAKHAKTNACELALFGHTHAPHDSMLGGVRLVNPGALKMGRWALIDATDRLGVRLVVL